MGSFTTHRLKILGVASALAVSIASANAADMLPPPLIHSPMPSMPSIDIGGNWYLRGDVGVGMYADPKVSLVDQTAPPDLNFLSKGMGEGAIIGAGVGYQFNSWLRADVTAQYRAGVNFSGLDRGTYVANAFNVGTGVNEPTTWAFNNVYGGKVSAFVALANGYIDLGTWNCLTPYIGFGVGVANLRFGPLSDQGVVGPINTAVYNGFGPTGGGYAAEKTKTNFAWAVHAGVAYDVNPNLKLELGYSYLNMGSVNSGDIVSSFLNTNTRNNYIRLKDIQSHDFKIGMRWMFGDPNCCAKPMAPPPPAYPVVAKY
jgi:opacity protein-like surface antigen